jgi:hypothetical protein
MTSASSVCLIWLRKRSALIRNCAALAGSSRQPAFEAKTNLILMLWRFQYNFELKKRLWAPIELKSRPKKPLDQIILEPIDFFVSEHTCPGTRRASKIMAALKRGSALGRRATRFHANSGKSLANSGKDEHKALAERVDFCRPRIDKE